MNLSRGAKSIALISLLSVFLTACAQLPPPRKGGHGPQVSKGTATIAQDNRRREPRKGQQVSQTVLNQLLRKGDQFVTPPGKTGPFPTVVFFHGCGGMSNPEYGWAKFWLDRGFAVLGVRSYVGRGWNKQTIAGVCRAEHFPGYERSADTLVTLAHLRTMPQVDANRIVLMGWSHGGWTLLDMLAQNPPKMTPPILTAPVREPSGNLVGLQGVRGVITLYPYCGKLSFASKNGLKARVPLLMSNAGADRIVPHEACEQLASRMQTQGYPIAAKTYPRANHGYDATKNPRVYDPAAVADTQKRVDQFLRQIGF